MKTLTINIKVNPSLYLRDPKGTKLGINILSNSVLLIDDIGFDQFTFKKLAKIAGCTETSVYRYFENKHHLFVYLLNWYWEWMCTRVELNSLNINDPRTKLKIAIDVIADVKNRHTDMAFLDEEALHRVVVVEGTKAYHHKLIDEDNKEGFFLSYKKLCAKFASFIQEINPSFPYPRAMASMLIETANNNIYFSEHLPRLTDIKYKDETISDEIKALLHTFTACILNYENPEKHK